MLRYRSCSSSVALLLLFSLPTSVIAIGCSDDGNGSSKNPPVVVVPPAPLPTTPAPTAPPLVAPVTPKLETVACRFLVPSSEEGKSFHCADLTVPEDRRAPDANNPNNPNTRTIKIHVAIINGKPGGVPQIELVGGPGGSSEETVGGMAAKTSWAMASYGKALEVGDLVLFDQRGTGRSIPRLWCDLASSLSSCRAGFEKQGINLAAYDTISNAEDVHDLKVALGVPKVDLHGISYGTRLNIEIMKRHPEDVRASIIDGVLPPDIPLLGTFNIAIDGILTQVFTACVADTKCNTTYPTLEDTFSKVKKKLDATPFQVKNDPQFGDYTYDWSAFTQDLIQRAYEEGFASHIPSWIHALEVQTLDQWTASQAADEAAAEKQYNDETKADQGNALAAELLTKEMASTEDDYEAADMAYGMYLSVTCNDYTQHETLAGAKAALTKIRPELQDIDGVTEEAAECDAWAKRTSDPSVQTASTFAGPVFAIGGHLDPATPYTWAEHVVSSLPSHQLVEVPTGGHGLMDDCGTTMKRAFFIDPTQPIESTCATNRSIQFFYPDPTSALTHSHHPQRLRAVALRPNVAILRTTTERVAARVLASVSPNLRASLYHQRLVSMSTAARTHR